MAAIHLATNNPKARELVDVVVAAINEVREYAQNQGAMIGLDKAGAADFAVSEIVDHLRDHLQIDLAVTLASWGVE